MQLHSEMARGNHVAYYRVSTKRQGRSGLGLDDQRRAVLDYLDGGNWNLIEEFTEIESGKGDDRPQLEAAIKTAKKHRAKLVIAKLDRLGRRAGYIMNLLDFSKVRFVFLDMPEADKGIIGLMAAVAEIEGRAISKRTKAALAVKKAQLAKEGKRLGAPDPAKAAPLGGKAMKAKAARFAANVLPIIREIEAAGITSNLRIAKALNARGVRSPRGGEWGDTSVRNIRKRVGKS